MRAPFQILAIPYRVRNDILEYCILHRADCDQWQFIAGGGEDSETPWDAAKREAFEEGGISSENWLALESLAYLPVTVISAKCRQHWDRDLYVIPEYAFGVFCSEEIVLSDEHSECEWLTFDDAMKKTKWDSNRTALYELNCRLMNG